MLTLEFPNQLYTNLLYFLGMSQSLASKNKLENTANRKLFQVQTGTVQDYETAITEARRAYDSWCEVPAPRRGEVVRQIGDRLRSQLQNLGKLVGFRSHLKHLSL